MPAAPELAALCTASLHRRGSWPRIGRSPGCWRASASRRTHPSAAHRRRWSTRRWEPRGGCRGERWRSGLRRSSGLAGRAGGADACVILITEAGHASSGKNNQDGEGVYLGRTPAEARRRARTLAAEGGQGVMKKVLLQLDNDRTASVFDAVTAYDAGADVLLQYGGVEASEVRALVYGAMFTRAPSDLKNSAIFVGGTDVATGEVMLKEVCGSFFGPVRVSVMPVSYTHLRAHETRHDLVCRLLLAKKKIALPALR